MARFTDGVLEGVVMAMVAVYSYEGCCSQHWLQLLNCCDLHRVVAWAERTDSLESSGLGEYMRSLAPHMNSGRSVKGAARRRAMPVAVGTSVRVKSLV